MVVLPETEYKRIKKSVEHAEELMEADEMPDNNKKEEGMAIATNQPTMENIVETAKMREEIAPTSKTTVMAEDTGDERRGTAAVKEEGGLLESLLIRTLPQGVGKRAIVSIVSTASIQQAGTTPTL
jgi:hypothetical protein